MPKKPNKKNRRMWSGIKPGDENFTSIPANIGLSEEQLKWEGMSFWQRAQKSEYFQREGKEHWLRACILLNSEEDFRIAYKMGPPDIYTNETLRTSDLRRRRMTIDSLTKMHPEIIFPKPLQNIQPEPLGPLYGVVMLKDLAFDQLLLYVQSGTYFYPDTPTDEINEMVQQFKKSLKAECRNWNESMASEGTGNKAPPPPPQTTNVAGSQKDAKNEAKKKSEEQGEEMLAQRVHPPSIFGGILRQKSSPMKPKKNVVASGYQMVDNENVRQAMDAPLDDDGWDDF